MQEFSMVGGYMEELKKPQNCQNWGVGACPGQYGMRTACVGGGGGDAFVTCHGVYPYCVN